MIKYYVNDRGINWAFDSREEAEKKAREIGGKVERRIFWRYFAPYYSTTSGIREITGKDLASAIESNFDRIIRDHFEFGAGYHLNYAALEKTIEGAELVIDLNVLGILGTPGKRKSKRIRIEGVEPGDMDSEKIDLLSK